MFGMNYEEFYSLRLSEAIRWIEVKQKVRNDNYDLDCNFFGQLCATIATFSGNVKKGKRYTCKDFYKFSKKEEKEMSIEEVDNMLIGITQNMGGIINI